MCIPENVILLIGKLYKDSFHFIRRGGKRFRAFAITSGILQGCPLSAALFDLAIDPLLRNILLYIPYNIGLPRETLDAYLDDVSMVVSNVFVQLNILLLLCDMFTEACGPALNLSKCLIIPLWTDSVEAAKTLLARMLPRAALFKVALAGKLLGVWVGPEAAEKGWGETCDKIQRRIGMVKNFELGLWGTIRELNIHCFFLLFSHILAYYCPPGRSLFLREMLTNN